jgi:hypothetical protein
MTDPLRPPTPRPELLAAYIDGELDPATAARVEAWLLTDPHACELLDEQYLLSRSHREFWRAVSPPEPSTARWNHLLHQIDERLQQPPASPAQPLPCRHTPPPTPARRWSFTTSVSLAIALALLVIVTTWRQQRPERDLLPLQSPLAIPVVETFAVLSESEIEINSVHAQDGSALVVGDSVLRQPLVLANIHDFALDSMQCDEDGLLPNVPMSNGSMRPMILAPMDSVRD